VPGNAQAPASSRDRAGSPNRVNTRGKRGPNRSRAGRAENAKARRALDAPKRIEKDAEVRQEIWSLGDAADARRDSRVPLESQVRTLTGYLDEDFEDLREDKKGTTKTIATPLPTMRRENTRHYKPPKEKWRGE
jgi:hypothetical protein